MTSRPVHQSHAAPRPASESVRRRRQAVRQLCGPLGREHGFEELRVQGKLPEDLWGTLVRNGPGLLRRVDGEPYQHLFDGDGVVSAVRFLGGRAEGAMRVVQGERLLEERRTGKALWGAGLSPARGWHRRVLARGSKNLANTNVLLCAGKLYALFEGGLPTALSLEDLSTLGETDFGGVIRHMYSAHPHRHAARGTVYNFGLRYGRHTKLDLYAMGSNGQARHLAAHKLAPGTTMLHDFAMTQDHFLFFVAPVRIDRVSVLLGIQSPLESMRYLADEATQVLVVPIDNPTACTRFEVPSFYNFHAVNAFESGGKFIVDMPYFPRFPYQGLRLTKQGNISFGATSELQLKRAIVDPRLCKVDWEVLSRGKGELPTVSPNVVGKPYRYSYMVVDDDEAHIPALIGKVDVETGSLQTLDLGVDSLPSEPVFVPRASPVSEDDGYLLVMVFDAGVAKSYLGVFDARDLSKAPLAKAWFDHAVPYSLHGGWASARQ